MNYNNNSYVYIESNDGSQKTSNFVINGNINENIIRSTPEERQRLLDNIGKKLCAESRLWRIFSIIYILIYLASVFFCVASFFSVIFSDEMWEEDVYYYDDGFYYEDEFYFDGNYTSAEVGQDHETEYYESEELTETDIYILLFMFLFFFSTVGFFYYVPAVIIGFVMAGKTAKARKKLYIECDFAYRRCSSPLSIIMGVLFNPWTLICSIPLFVIVRKNKVLLNEIALIQRSYFNAY